MDYRADGACRQLVDLALSIAATAFIFLILADAKPVYSQTTSHVQSKPLIVHNDRGGLLRARLLKLGELRKSQRPVKITGAICYSTCTMYLGLPQTCISPDTVFGFHGPSSYGKNLKSVAFERASKIIAGYYPSALRKWYMAEGRYKLQSVYKVKGRQIIAMGIRQCREG
ncbi:MAG TPA: hypothetical protein DC031_17490 [Sulfitobacter sp.]|jgi:hypothetical protein|uniref:hypothetical protein n=1 Tax=Sulfitobacter dubius TaxID=218673 RepID=UPI000C6768F1|nr:hypothetical protein [Sulfitobacter sp.]HBB85005.1 hypothetical protein [Sulfitobacter sp.]